MVYEPSTFEKEVSKMEFVNLKAIVLRLKDVKEKEKLSIQDIVNRVAESGGYISESTVRRVFKDNSENELGFTYKNALKPIADVLLTDEEETADDPALPEKNKALHAIIEEKNRQIEVLQEKNDSLTVQLEELKRNVDEVRKQYDARIDSLWEQIHLKDRRMDSKDELIQRVMDANDQKDKTINELNESVRDLLKRCQMCEKKK